MKTFYLPFTSTTTGVYTIRAASLEDARAEAEKGFPYELGETIVDDTNTKWNFDLMYGDDNNG